MKKSFLWLAGAAVLAACAQTELETVETKEPVKQEIKLDVYMQGQTRAEDTTADNLKSFQLAIMQGEAYYGDDVSSPYTMSYAENAWTFGESVSTPTWPLGDSTLDFYAWQEAGGTFVVDARGNKTMTFASENVDKKLRNTDWVVACATEQKQPASGDPITLAFQHVMSKATFTVTSPGDGYLYYIKSIKINDYPSANYYFDVNDWKDHGRDMATITVFEAAESDEVTYGDENQTTLKGAKQLSDPIGGNFYLIPDETDSNNPVQHNVTVEYYVFSPASEGSTTPVSLIKSYVDESGADGSKTATLTTVFNPGAVVEVNIELDSEAIAVSLATSVDSWPSSGNGNALPDTD